MICNCTKNVNSIQDIVSEKEYIFSRAKKFMRYSLFFSIFMYIATINALISELNMHLIELIVFAAWIYYCNSTKVYYFNTDARNFVCKYNGIALWWLGWIVQVFIFSHINTYMGQIPFALIPDIIYRFIYNNNAKNDYICGKGIKIFEGETIAHVYILDNGMEKEISIFSLY